ncbi:hypothetical protein D910_09435 [Dendroctonus ponderosae]|uniref:Uncharacterized protein n=1 Tax=Dendroctonus ponderosae TaxID=77166 RepID=U4UDR3_DENPD|nr:hypothetical protein D910_09435 [Dendroctonus ponderosae]
MGFIHWPVLFQFYFVLVSSLHLPPQITKCRKTDAICMSKSITDALLFFANGSEEFGFPKFEPFYVELLEITGDPDKSATLSQRYDNVFMHGMTDTQVKHFRLQDDEQTCKWEIDTYTPITRMNADYSLSGQILVFPINGHGKCNVTMSAYFQSFERKNLSKIHVMNMSVESCQFDFPNIIPGNEQISREVEKTVNENALEIFKEVKGGFEQVFSKLYKNTANSLFSKIPEDELFLP